MPTYSIIKGTFGHMSLMRHITSYCYTRIEGEKPWAGGNIVIKFRSRSDNAAIKRYKKYLNNKPQIITYYDHFGKLCKSRNINVD